MRILKFILIIAFSISSFVIHAKGQPKTIENPYKELGTYMYFNLRLLECSTYVEIVTLRRETILKNKIQSIVFVDSVESHYYNFKGMMFDTCGRLISLHVGPDTYEFEYDSLLETKGFQRISHIYFYYENDCQPPRGKRNTYYSYDGNGNLISISTDADENIKATYIYSNSRRYQYVRYSVTADVNTYTDNIVYKYDKWTGNLFQSKKGAPYIFLGKLIRDNGKKLSDSLRYNEGELDCFDTISDGRYYHVESSNQREPFYHIKRDKTGKIISVRNEWEHWNVEYDENDLPSCYEYLYEDGEWSSSFTCAFKYTYYP